MWRFSGLLVGVGLLFGAVSPANAYVVQLPLASLSISIGNLSAIDIPWNITGCIDTTSTSIVGLTPGIFNLSGAIPVTDPGSSPILGVSVSGASNGVGNFAFDSAGNGIGTMAIGGVWTLCLFASCGDPTAEALAVPFIEDGAGVGVGDRPIFVDAPVHVKLTGGTWTTGTVMLGGRSETGSPYVTGPSPMCSVCNFGDVTLVSAALISTDLDGASSIPVIARLNLNYNLIPEPETALLLGAGVALLAMVGRQRR